MKNVALLVFVCLLSPDIAAAGDPKGTVRVPLDAYQQLVRASQQDDDAASGKFALGEATATVELAENGIAEVQVELTVRILDARWTLVPLLPAGTALIGATDQGSPTQLVVGASGLAFGSNQAGEHRIALTYRAQVSGSGDGRLLALPLPAATGTQLSATLPGSGIEVAVIPSASFSTESDGGTTTISATLPSTAGVQISWKPPARNGYAISRASYQGELIGDAIAWNAVLDAEVFGSDAVLPLFPKGTTLSGVTVDGKSATVLSEGDTFATLLKGRGRHRIEIQLETPVTRDSGPPRVDLSIPEIPISRFDLRLPGKKELAVEPAANVRLRFEKNATLATIQAPMTSQLQLTWTEAVPEEVEEDVRANATIYHAIHAEEGVLHGRATIAFEVTRGKTSVVRFSVPDDVQINRITADNASVTDWRTTKSGRSIEVSAFLDRKLSGAVKFEVQYERLGGTGPDAADIMAVPLLSMLDVHRQRGMVALLSSAELALKPTEQKNLSRVGENQLPDFFRSTLEMTVAHTFKYADAAGVKLSVQAVPPEHKDAKFDAEVDTLLSLADVTMKGSATVRINVKSGKMEVLRLELPPDVTLLNLSAPSKRAHTTKLEDGVQHIDLHFTQEMEGEFPVDLEYERIILGRGATDHGAGGARRGCGAGAGSDRGRSVDRGRGQGLDHQEPVDRRCHRAPAAARAQDAEPDPAGLQVRAGGPRAGPRDHATPGARDADRDHRAGALPNAVHPRRAGGHHGDVHGEEQPQAVPRDLPPRRDGDLGRSSSTASRRSRRSTSGPKRIPCRASPSACW